MESFAPFLVVFSTVVPICVSGVLIARIYRKNSALDPKITHKLRRQQEEYIHEIEKKNRTLQNKLNSMQRGPSVPEGQGQDDMISSLLGQAENFLPKWAVGPLKTLKNNPDVVNYVKEYIEKNPEKAKDIIGQLTSRFKSKNITKTPGDPSNSMLGL